MVFDEAKFYFDVSDSWQAHISIIAFGFAT